MISDLRITSIEATPVTVPMKAPLRWSMGVETGTTRCIIQVHTEAGITGIGETYGGSSTVRAVKFLEQRFRGIDCWSVDRMARIAQAFRIAYETFIPAHVYAGIEMAVWDILGKSTGQSVASLLGGTFRQHIPVSAYLFYRYVGEDGIGGEDTPAAMADRAEALVEAHGFRVVKFKGGVHAPEEELATLRALRQRLPHVKLRYDPNAAWSVETAITILPQMAEVGLEYAEDPTDLIEGMSRLRAAVAVPLATNMCVTRFSDIPLGFRMGAVDIILSDVHFWGGLAQCRKLAGVAETLQLGLGMHSDRELGISTAAMVQFAAATPTLMYAIDSHYHDQVDDIITTPWTYVHGGFRLPPGPGLGVEVDWDKVRHYHQCFLQDGEVNEFFDSHRPDWIPILPLY